MAIVTTLWSLALLAAIAFSLSLAGNVSYRLAHNNFQAASDDTAADAAINRTVLALLDPRMNKRWPTNRTTERFDFADQSIGIRVQDELGKIDLNQADGSNLIKLFQWAGLDETAADALTDKVLDWRDSSPLKRIHGAKAAEYMAAAYSYLPRNGPFQSVDELNLVMGVTPNLYRRIEPALTVYSGHQFVDPQSATPEVVSALPWLAGERAAIDAQQSRTNGLPFGSVGTPMNVLKGRAYAIDIDIPQGGSTLHRHVVVRLTGNANEPFWILSWQRS